MRKHPLAICEECPLFEGTTYVPSSIPMSASLAIIGEAPGREEIKLGQPFVGPPGKLLDIVLKHHSIDRNDTFLGNAVGCRAKDNSAPTTQAIACCRPRLVAELEDSGINTVVALGNSALESVYGKSGVTTLRPGPGRYGTILGPDVRIIPTIHPSACIHAPDNFPHIVADIGKVNIQPKPWVEPSYVVPADEDTTLSFIKQVHEKNPPFIVIDIEIDIEKDDSFEIPSTYKMLCIGISIDRNNVLIITGEMLEYQSVRALLGYLFRSYPIVAQNGKFDLKGLQPIFGKLELYGDTMLASYAFDERPGIHGLKYQAQEYLGAPKYDEEILKFVTPGTGYGAIPKDLLFTYNAIDVASTYDLWLMYEKKFARDEQGAELRRVHDHLVKASNALMAVELAGIRIDEPYLNVLDAEFTLKLAQTELEMSKIIGIKNYDKNGGINPRSPKQVKAYLADNKIMVDSTNVDSLEVILSKKSLPINETEVRTFVKTLLQHRGETKTYGTYIKGVRERMHGSKVFPTFLLHGTTTGRLSCRNPNLQNIPRESSIRRMFIPEHENNLFLQVDYSQAELRVLSYLARDTYFRDIFNAGDRDVFDDLTPILYPGKVKAELSSAEWKELRIKVKAFVYGLNYGREAKSIATEFDISMNEANTLKRNFFNVIPHIVAFQTETKKSVLNGEELVTPWGRHRRFSLITDYNRHNVMNEALAFLPQSTASDMCLQAMYWSVEEIGDKGTIRNIVHDSILVEGHKDDIEYLREVISRNMIKSAEQIVGGYVKFAVDSNVGRDWSEV